MYDLGEGPWNDAYFEGLPDRLPERDRLLRAGFVGDDHLILNVERRNPGWGGGGRLLVEKSDMSQCKLLGSKDERESYWGLAWWHPLDPEYILLVIRDTGNTITRIARVADFLEWPSELCSGATQDITKELISEGRMKELQSITVDAVSWQNPDFVDLGEKRFLGEGVLIMGDRNYAFCKPDGWTGNLGQIKQRELEGTVHSMHAGMSSVWANSSAYTDTVLRHTCIKVLHLGPGDILQLEEETHVEEVTYMCRLKHRGGGYYTVLLGHHVADSEYKMWAYDYMNGTFAELDVPMGKWVATSETTMKRVKDRHNEKLILREGEIPDDSDMMDVNDFPEFKTIDAFRPFKNYESSCRDANILKIVFRRICRGYGLGSHPLGDIWEAKDETVGRFRVIAGMGPVPAMLRSKKYKDIKFEDFGDYLGGPIFFSTNRDYPILCRACYIDAFKYRSGRVVEVVLGEPKVSMSSLVWFGVVDIDMEEAPLEHHSIEEACVDSPMTDDGRPYFEVKSGQLAASAFVNEGPKVGNVAIGRWFYKTVTNGEEVSQLIAWHESVDDDPEFQAPSEMHYFDTNYPECLSYDDQKVLRDKCMDLVDPVLEYGNVPMDVRDYVGDYLVEHQDSTYWIGALNDGWMVHSTPMKRPVVGLFDSEKLGHLSFREDVIVHHLDEYRRRNPWEENIYTIPRGSVRGMPGGCIYRNRFRGWHSVEFKFKNPQIQSSDGLGSEGQIHAARIVHYWD